MQRRILIDYTHRDNETDRFIVFIIEFSPTVRIFDTTLRLNIYKFPRVKTMLKKCLDVSVTGRALQTWFELLIVELLRIPNVENWYFPPELINKNDGTLKAELFYPAELLDEEVPATKLKFEHAQVILPARNYPAPQIDDIRSTLLCAIHRFNAYKTSVSNNYNSDFTIHAFVIKANDNERITLYCNVVNNNEIIKIYWSKHRGMDKQMAVYVVEAFIQKYLKVKYKVISR